ncbi:hypothetical protein MLD52_18780 [Puniceicoccaceae bacterium K14]|nr:hypothetical protein [Puniceicoccaceae bacterium K14]
MNYAIVATITYLTIATAITLYVGKILRANGKPFLKNAFADAPELAESINVLLNVGFYLVSLGIIGASLKYSLNANNMLDAINITAYRLGIELLILGGLHLMNLKIINRFRRNEKAKAAIKPTLENA